MALIGFARAKPSTLQARTLLERGDQAWVGNTLPGSRTGKVGSAGGGSMISGATPGIGGMTGGGISGGIWVPGSGSVANVMGI
jgi:hypothetical protein